MTTLQDRKAVAAEQLAALTRSLGAQALDGGEPDAVHAAIDRARREIDEIDAAASEAVRRQRQERDDAAATRLAELRRALVDKEAERLAAIEQAEAAARTLAIAMRKALDVSFGMRRTMQEIGGRLSDGFDPGEAELRLTGRLATVLATASKHPAKFGVIGLRLPFFATAKDCWREVEEREGAKALAPFLEQPRYRTHERDCEERPGSGH